jgi:hypothetical protein
MAFAEDLSYLEDAARGFAVDAVYSVGPATIRGIFDAAYFEPFGGQMQGNSPAFTTKTSNVPSAAHGQTLTIGGTVYTVVGVEPDGTGVTVLRLRK